jgi:hypothetical protein
MGIVGTIGTASTGAAIGGLAGAAKTTASLYWIGGLVGGGVAAGTVMIGAGALGAGIYGSIKLRRALMGSSRRDSLSETEERIVLAITTLVHAIDETLNADRVVSPKELVLFSRLGITPIRDTVQRALDDGAFSELSTYHRVLLRGHINNLTSLQERIAS